MTEKWKRTSAASKASAARWQMRKYQRMKGEVDAYKLEKGCADCGYRARPEPLSFDHLPGVEKTDNVADLLWRKKEQVMWDEIAKCEVVCANCHAIRTASRKPENKDWGDIYVQSTSVNRKLGGGERVLVRRP